ncbi:MAG: hypothetical protein IT555_00370 [Acetobacteraceae bacterium]|nr:hypothetical protein [Acetobacteraceae bacterium]
MDAETRVRLYEEHPDESPELSEAPPWLIHPPSRLSSTASWRRFRDGTLLPLIAARPDDEFLPQFLAQTEAVLAWRAALSPEQRFWKAD